MPGRPRRTGLKKTGVPEAFFQCLSKDLGSESGHPQPMRQKGGRMTLQELMDKVETAPWRERVPSEVMIRESGSPVVATEQMGSEIKITVYQNGYVVYQSGETTTVFPVHKCGDFVEHDRTGREHVMPYEVFADQPWQMRIYLEGERRIWHNKKAVRRNRGELSCDVLYFERIMVPEWDEMDPLQLVVDAETAREEKRLLNQVLNTFSDKQRYILIQCIVKGRKQSDVAKEMGMTRMNVTYTLGQSLKKLRAAFGTGDREFRVNRFCRTEGNEAKGNIK